MRALDLPTGYDVAEYLGSLILYGPDGERIAMFGPAYSVVAVEDVAWLDFAGEE